MAKTLVSVGDKVIKLREERQLLAGFLVIQQSRTELVPRLPATIGNYEMWVIPRSMFVSDGSLFIPTHKAPIMHAVEDANPIRTETQTPTETIMQAPRAQTPAQASRHQHKIIHMMASSTFPVTAQFNLVTMLSSLTVWLYFNV